MASCPGRVEALSALIDGELTPAEEIELRRHLDSCAICAAWREQFDALSGVVANTLGRERAPRDLAEQVGRLQPPSTRYRAVVLGAAAAAVLGALLLFARGRGSEGAFLVEDHRRFVSGQESLTVPSSDPVEVARGLAVQLPFQVSIAKVPGALLRGGHACSLPGGLAAYLQYEREGERVSVFVSPSRFLSGEVGESCRRVEGDALCTFAGPHQMLAVVAARPETARMFRRAAEIESTH